MKIFITNYDIETAPMAHFRASFFSFSFMEFLVGNRERKAHDESLS